SLPNTCSLKVATKRPSMFFNTSRNAMAVQSLFHWSSSSRLASPKLRGRRGARIFSSSRDQSGRSICLMS
ncbi:hypothetical protein FRC09_016216, partial [Ceratobasidium sp. 395]